MPLKNGAINEILQFAAEALEDAGDVLPLETYKNHPMRLRGHMAGLALRELQNREARHPDRHPTFGPLLLSAAGVLRRAYRQSHVWV